MSEGLPFAGEPADSHEAIMRATFCALQEHGYAGLSIQRIADQADLSKSTFYHHFEDKEDLLLSFVEFMLAEFDRVFQLESTGDPAEDLRTYLALITGDHPAIAGRPEEDEVLSTYLELRAQAIRNPEFRAKFTEMDEGFAAQLSDLLADGIEAGVFADVDPDQTARFLLTMAEGSIFKNATRTDDPLPSLQESIDRYVEREILADRAA
ncbi:TetR/AcrR family transcriptional regulator [Halomicroarcula sp. GCM10025817]|uniref:TetR/AcrR family transcriptional regulator n=1 Tax=Haloarcula TaxID=2237 RepID=UPI0023E81854|nr:TetR/AcrR family transcriptional regulator [Halomicroarcula sp. SYNS111]